MSDTVRWDELTKKKRFEYATGEDHVIKIKREVIPVIFVPGIMGSRLARKGKVVWDPKGEHDGGATTSFFLSQAQARRSILVGTGKHSSTYLKVHLGEVEHMPGNGTEKSRRHKQGWGGLLANSYMSFMTDMESFLLGGAIHTDYGRYFEFPLYGMGYNWTADNAVTGHDVAARTNAIIAEHNNDDTFCEKVIYVTHSMGGLASRSAMFLHSMKTKTLGAIHGVQPVTGGPAAYKRVRKGFAGDYGERNFLGDNPEDVTVIFANSPGALELLPTKHHKNNAGEKNWLKVRSGASTNDIFSLPQNGDPFSEIYAQRTCWWRLVDETLVDPATNGQSRGSPGWGYYTTNLSAAKKFHGRLGRLKHDNTYEIYGIGTKHPTFDGIIWDLEIDYILGNEPLTAAMRNELAGNPDAQPPTNGVQWIQGNDVSFNLAGEQINGSIRDASGSGDGTVPAGSGRALTGTDGSKAVSNVGHEPAYKNSTVSTAAKNAITRLVKDHFDDRVKKAGG